MCSKALFAEHPIQTHQVRWLSSSPEIDKNTNGKEAHVAVGCAVSVAPWGSKDTLPC